MSEPHCERCGGPLEAGGLDGCCARCLMEIGLESGFHSGENHGDFRLLTERTRRRSSSPEHFDCTGIELTDGQARARPIRMRSVGQVSAGPKTIDPIET